MQGRGLRHRTSHFFSALALGAILGALILGVGARLAMRGITLLENRPHQWTPAGSLTVVAYGGAFGLVAGALRAGLAVLPVSLTERSRATVFAVVCLGVAIVGLTPLTANRLALFLPIIALYVVALEIAWRRYR